jgi:L-alanine-DL-glutamate epimerase-like enolase superfamily enzyme
MKITSVQPFLVRAGIPRAVGDSVNQAVTIGFVGVKVRTDTGLEGTGFTVTLGQGEEPIREVLERYYVPALIGENPLRTQALWEKLYWCGTHWVGRQGVTQMALAAVDIALWDLKAKAFGVPLWVLVGGHKDGSIRSYNTDGGWLNFPVPQLVEEMHKILDAGWTGVKMKIGLDNPREDLRRVAAAREAIGDDVELMLDVNQRWNLTTAIGWAHYFEEFRIGWLEEPIDPDDVDGHARLADTTSIPLAAGEHIYHRTGFRDMITRGRLTFIQADVTRLGGITEWLAVAELALANRVSLIPHCGDLMRVHQHLGVGHPAVPMIECIPWLQHLFAEPADIRGGVFHVPMTPGASTTFDPGQFDRYRVS